MPRQLVREIRRNAWLALVLAWIAGCVDAIGYLTLGRVFIAHVSGNSAAVGAFLGQSEWKSMLHRLAPIPLFVVGVAFGAMLVEICLRSRIRHVFAICLLVEAILLLLYLTFGAHGMASDAQKGNLDGAYLLLVALASIAMGMQNTTLRKVGNESIRTTYVSGMITNMAEEAVAICFWLAGQHSCGPARFKRAARTFSRQPSFQRMLLYGGIWTAFLGGAVTGGVTVRYVALLSILFPVAGLFVVIIADLYRPIAALDLTPPDKPGRPNAAQGRHRA